MNLKVNLPNSIEALAGEYRGYGEKFKRAAVVVEKKNVKLHRFYPSGREIWTVVGLEGDQLVDESQHYCSCRHFHYKVLRHKDETCYHLLSTRIAKRLNLYDTIKFQDVEYFIFLKYLITDIFQSATKKRIKGKRNEAS